MALWFLVMVLIGGMYPRFDVLLTNPSSFYTRAIRTFLTALVLAGVIWFVMGELLTPLTFGSLPGHFMILQAIFFIQALICVFTEGETGIEDATMYGFLAIASFFGAIIGFFFVALYVAITSLL